jgi:hypothetical protein
MHTLSIPEIKQFVRHIVFDMREPVMIWGQPGVGKSQGIKQLCTEMGAIMVDIRLGQYDSVDLRGIPVPDMEEELTVWHVPSTLPFKGNPRFDEDGAPILLFLDEINGAAPAVSGVAYQLVEDRGVGEHKLMDNVYLVAAGNRESDRGVTNRQPLPLSNRFTHVEATTNVEAWSLHAQSMGWPQVGVAFLNFRKELLSTFSPEKPDKAFATPRTWAKALKYFANDKMPLLIKQAGMAGAVGQGPAAEFWGFVDIWQKMTPLKDIEKNPTTVKVPEDMSMKYAVSVAISGALTAKNVKPFHTFLKRMDPEFVVLAWQLASKRDESLFSTPEFLDVATTYKSVFQPGR